MNKLWVKGYKRTEDEERKRVESLKGREAWNKGVPRAQEVRNKISKTMIGHIPSDEMRRKSSIAQKGIKRPWYKRKTHAIYS